MFANKMFVLCTVVLTGLSATLPLAADSRVTFELDGLPMSNFVNRTSYIVTVWAKTGDHDWEISAFNLGVEYNGDALLAPELVQVNPYVLDDSYSVDLTLNPGWVPPWFRLNVLKFVGPRALVPAYSRVWLARIRLTLIASDPSDMQTMMLESDDLRIKEGDIISQVFHGDVMLNYGADDELGWNVPSAGNSQQIAHCNNAFYRFENCQDFDEWFTSDPLSNGAARWFPESGTGGFAQVYYRYDFDNDGLPSGPDESFEFDSEVLEAIGDECICAWSAQTGDRMHWTEATAGGRMHFTTLFDDMGSADEASSLAAVTQLVSIDSSPEEKPIRIVDTTQCGPLNKRKSSRIVFNNTPEFYRNYPDVRWTTCAPHGDGPFGCDEPVGISLIDFRSVFHHELGHYLGLAHSVHPDDLMHGWGTRTNDVQVKFTQCDADRLRRLYSPGIIGEPPVNFGARRGKYHDAILMESCSVIDDVKVREDVKSHDAGAIAELRILPTPLTSGQGFVIHYSIPESGPLRLSMYDAFGRRIATLLNDYRSAGEYVLHVDGSDIATGMVLFRLEMPGLVLAEKSLVSR